MSKKSEKNPVPEDGIQRFMQVVLSLVEPFGVDKEEDVHHYVVLLQKAVERNIFNRKNKGSLDTEEKREIRKFIAIFKQRYLQLVDNEYTDRPTPIEGRLIKSVVGKVQEAGLTGEDYLKWTFDEFLPENRKFIPPNIKQICANTFVAKFIYEKRGDVEKKKEMGIQSKDITDLANRSKALIRNPDVPEADKKNLRKALKKTTSGDIILEELRTQIEGFEAQLR
jgi:hypothetical protein